MSADALAHHYGYLGGALAEAVTAPLSRKKTLLVMLLIDGFVDRLFEARGMVTDRLAYRAELTAGSPALRLVFEVTAGRAGLEIRTVPVPLEEYGGLSTADFMVSLYNANTVQRLMVVPNGGEPVPAPQVVAEAMTKLDMEMQRAG